MAKYCRLGLAALIVALALPAFGQMGAVQGYCTDQQGKPIVGGTVEFKRTDINAVYKVKTDKHGHYGHYGLPLGTFDVILFGPDGKQIYALNNVPTTPGEPKEVDFDMRKLLNPDNAMQGMSKEQQEALKKQQEEEAQTKQKVGNINQMLAQNQQLAAAGQWDQAIQVMQQAVTLSQGLKLTPQSQAIIQTHLAEDYAGAKQFDKAVAAYQQALTLVPATDVAMQANIYNNMGSAESQAGKTADAQAAFDKSAQLDPANAKTAYYNEGAIFYNAGNMDAAAAAFDKVVKLDPTYANAWYLRGMALLAKGTVDPKTGKASYPPGTEESFETYLKLAPNGQYADSAAGALEGITGKVATSYRKRPHSR